MATGTKDRRASTPAARLGPIDEARAQRRLILEAGINGAQDSFSGGQVLLAYVLFLGGSPFDVGLVATAQTIGSTMQIFADRLLLAPVKMTSSRKKKM